MPESLHVLLVAAESSELERELVEVGLRVSCARDLEAAVDVLQASRIDLSVLSHPLPNSDLIAGCAALRGRPESPPLVLLDATDQSAELERLIPQAMHPARVLPRPVDGPKLASQLVDLLERPTDPLRRPDAPIQLARRLSELGRQRATGVLEVKNEGRRTRIRLADGRVTMVEGGSLRDTLGRMLLRRRELSKADYLQVIKRMSERAGADHPMRMGEVLVELGLKRPEQVFDSLGEQLAGKVVACFRAPSHHAFRREEPGSEVGGFGISKPAALVVRGLCAHLPASEARSLLAREAREATDPPALVLPAATLVTRLSLPDDLAEQLCEIDGQRSLDTLVGAAGRASEAQDRMARLLAGLWLVGQLKRAPTALVAEEAANSMTAKPATAATAPPTTSTELPVSEPEPDRTRPRLEAEQAFREGQEHLAADRVEEALSAFGRAVEFEPLEPEYRMYEAWAAYHAARVQVRVQRARLTACARKVTEEDESCAAAHTILGRLALDEANPALARREFQAALLRDPDDADARAGLDCLESQAGPFGKS